jgi:hypothetical protein
VTELSGIGSAYSKGDDICCNDAYPREIDDDMAAPNAPSSSPGSDSPYRNPTDTNDNLGPSQEVENSLSYWNSKESAPSWCAAGVDSNEGDYEIPLHIATDKIHEMTLLPTVSAGTAAKSRGVRQLIGCPSASSGTQTHNEEYRNKQDPTSHSVDSDSGYGSIHR